MTTMDRQIPKTQMDYQPGTIKLRDTWIGLAHEASVKNKKPIRRMMHGEPVFFWREGGAIRGGSRPDPVTCAREGVTEFTRADGQYLVKAYRGLVWMWFGEPDNASPDLIPFIPQIPPDGGPAGFRREMRYECTFELMCENALDSTHIDFVHANIYGTTLGEEDEVYVESTSETVTMTRVNRGRVIPRAQRRMVGGATHQDQCFVVHLHVRSGLTVIKSMANPGFGLEAVVPHCPASPTLTTAPMLLDSASMRGLGKLAITKISPIVVRQDARVVKKQNENYLRGELHRDLSSRFDKATLRYRKVHNELAARQAAGDYSYLSDGDPTRNIDHLLEGDGGNVEANRAR
jgi:phenylpropionate dioxygenase-like ring-hydroxylating dioxygenase large terminal subunit